MNCDMHVCENCGRRFTPTKHASGKYCSGDCYHAARTTPPIERFRANVNRRTEKECWHWTGTVTRAGYGMLLVGKIKTYAHRFAWELATKQSIPAGLCVCHTCDNPPCVNPSHLFLGSKKDNSADAAQKRRYPHGPKHWSHVHPERVPRGDARTNTKVSDADARAAIAAIRAGQLQRHVAARYGVSRSWISMLVSGKRRHI